MYASVKELPSCVQGLLKGLEYHKKDIELKPRESVSPLDSGGAGLRGYFAMVNLETGKSDVRWGSWGGANMFNPSNPIDLDRNSYSIPVNGLVVKGCIGAYSHATIYLRPDAISAFLPEKQDVSDKQRRILACFSQLKSGAYRVEALQRIGATENELTELIQLGYLKQNKAGARQLTTSGKNAANEGPRVFV